MNGEREASRAVKLYASVDVTVDVTVARQDRRDTRPSGIHLSEQFRIRSPAKTRNMPKARPRKTRKIPKKSVSTDALQQAAAKLTKVELVELAMEIARSDSGIRRKIDSWFQLERSGTELIQETSMAISDATDFDERQMNRNFDYDYDAYKS